MTAFRTLMGLGPIAKPEPLARKPGTGYIDMRDARLRQARTRRAEREATRTAHVDIGNAPVTIGETKTAEGAFDASINGRANSRLKAIAKRG